MHFWQEEGLDACYLIMIGYSPDLDSPSRNEAPALITGAGCVQTVFGYPNEEAFWKDPRGELGHGCYEILGSSWVEHLHDYNRRSFGAPLNLTADLRHFFVGSKDTSCQILATALECEVFPELTFRSVVEESHRRARRRPPTTPEQREVNERYKQLIREKYGDQPPWSK